MSERFFIRATPEVRKAILHLAIDLDTGAEKLAGYLLADAISRVGRDIESARKLLPRKQAK